MLWEILSFKLSTSSFYFSGDATASKPVSKIAIQTLPPTSFPSRNVVVQCCMNQYLMHLSMNLLHFLMFFKAIHSTVGLFLALPSVSFLTEGRVTYQT